MLKTITRTAIGGTIKLARLPVDMAVKLTGRGGDDSPAGISLDRAEAGVRSAAGQILRDEEMVKDAALRREAADERATGQRLRTRAEERTEMASDAIADQKAQATERRRRARENAEKRRRKAQDGRTGNGPAQAERLKGEM